LSLDLPAPSWLRPAIVSDRCDDPTTLFGPLFVAIVTWLAQRLEWARPELYLVALMALDVVAHRCDDHHAAGFMHHAEWMFSELARAKGLPSRRLVPALVGRLVGSVRVALSHDHGTQHAPGWLCAHPRRYASRPGRCTCKAQPHRTQARGDPRPTAQAHVRWRGGQAGPLRSPKQIEPQSLSGAALSLTGIHTLRCAQVNRYLRHPAVWASHKLQGCGPGLRCGCWASIWLRPNAPPRSR